MGTEKQIVKTKQKKKVKATKMDKGERNRER